MSTSRKIRGCLSASFAAMTLAAAPALAQAPASKPNILFIMADDIGWMQVQAYADGMGVGETPNIDRLAKEGARFVDYVAMQSCTSGRNAFFTGMYPLRTGMIPPQLPGSPTYLKPGTPAVAVFLRDLGYNTGQSGKNHLGDHKDALPRRTASRSTGATCTIWTPCSRRASPTSIVRRPCRVSHRRARTRRSPGSLILPVPSILRRPFA